MLRRKDIVSLLTHPGYEVMSWLLTDSPLQATILSYIVDGIERFKKDITEEQTGLHNMIVPVLRITQ